MGFSPESVAAFIAVLGILSIIAQVSYCSVLHWFGNTQGAPWRASGSLQSRQRVSPLLWLFPPVSSSARASHRSAPQMTAASQPGRGSFTAECLCWDDWILCAACSCCWLMTAAVLVQTPKYLAHAASGELSFAFYNQFTCFHVFNI